jgi:hypothetical protein
MLTLSYYLQDGEIAARRFIKNQISIGAGKDCDLQLPNLADHHCRIYESTQGWYAEELASGVSINQYPGSGFIRDKDTLVVGPYAFRVQLEAAVPQQISPVAKKSSGGFSKFLFGCFVFVLLSCGFCYAGYRYWLKPWTQEIFGSSSSDKPAGQISKTPASYDFQQLKQQYSFDSLPQTFDARLDSDLRDAAKLLDLNEVQVRIIEAKTSTWMNQPAARNLSEYVLTNAELLEAHFEGKATTELEAKKNRLADSIMTEIVQPALQQAQSQGIECNASRDVPGAGQLGEALMGKWKQHQLGALSGTADWNYGFSGMYESSQQVHEERVGPLLAVWNNGLKATMGVETYEPPVLWMDARRGAGVSGYYGISGMDDDRMCGYVDWAWTDPSKTPARGIWWAERIQD